MANRFWVGGTATWNNTAGTKWALTSGGGGGQAIPTTSDDVFFDSASGAVTVTLSNAADQNAANISFSGFTGTFTGNGNLNTPATTSFIMGSGMTISWTGAIITTAGAGTLTITSNGKTFTGFWSAGNTNTITFADDFFCSNTTNPAFNIQSASGWTITANNKNIKIAEFVQNPGGVRTGTINMGTGVWEITNPNISWSVDATYLTLNPSTSTLKFTDSSNTILKPFFNVSGSSNLTYYNVWFARGASTGDIDWFNQYTTTWNGIRDTGTAAHILAFPENRTTTINTATQFLVTGSAGNLITITTAQASTGTHTLSCASGNISCDFLAIAHSVATGGTSFYAGVNSTNNQGIASAGSGWIFTAPPSGNKNLLLMGVGT